MKILNEVTISNQETQKPFDLLDGYLKISFSESDYCCGLLVNFNGENLFKLMQVIGIKQNVIDDYQEFLRITHLSRACNRSSQLMNNINDSVDWNDDNDDMLQQFYYNFNELREHLRKPNLSKENLSYELRNTMPDNAVDNILYVKAIESFSKNWLAALETEIDKNNSALESKFKTILISNDLIVLNKELGFKIEGDNVEKLFDSLRVHLELGLDYIIQKRLPKIKKIERDIQYFINFLKKEEYKTMDFTDEDVAYKWILLQVSVVSYLDLTY